MEYGANPNITDSEKRPPLYYSIRNGDLQIVELLLSHGARADLRDAFGGTALHIACKYQDKVELLASITNKAPEINNIDDDGETPLMYAARRNHWRTASYLITKGAVVDLLNVYGDSAVDHAVITDSQDVLRELMHAGGNTSSINKQIGTVIEIVKPTEDSRTHDLDTFYDAVEYQNVEIES